MSFLTSIDWVHPAWLWLLLVLLPLLFWFGSPGSRAELTFSSLRLLVSLGLKPKRRRGSRSRLAFVIGFLCSILALARPQFLHEESHQLASGLDLILAIDLSESMQTQDMRFQGESLSRLDLAKQLSADFVAKRPNDRIGLVPFAAHPIAKAPLTLHHDWLISCIHSLNPKELDSDGTAIGSAIALASSRLIQLKDTRSRVLILITDGANSAGALSPIDAAKYAKDLGIRIYTVAVGTQPQSSPPSAEHTQIFDPAILKIIAHDTQGEFFLAADAESFAAAFTSLDSLEKSEAKRLIQQQSIELFPYLIALACLAFVIHLALPLFSNERDFI